MRQHTRVTAVVYLIAVAGSARILPNSIELATRGQAPPVKTFLLAAPSGATTITAHGFSRGKREQFGEALERATQGTASRNRPRQESRICRLLLLVAESFDPVLDHPDGRWRRVFDRFRDDKTLAVGRDVVRGTYRVRAPVFIPKSRGSK